jgi:hypothetical protein
MISPLKLLGRSLMLGAAVLLLVDMFMPWQRLSIDGVPYAWDGWHGDKGIVLGVLVVAVVLWVGALGFGIPVPGRVTEPATPALAVLVLVFATAKNVREEYSAWGSYAGVALAAGVVAGALVAYRGKSAS